MYVFSPLSFRPFIRFFSFYIFVAQSLQTAQVELRSAFSYMQDRRQEKLSLTKREKLFFHFRRMIFFLTSVFISRWRFHMSKDGRRQPWATSMIVMTIRLFVMGDKAIPSSPPPSSSCSLFFIFLVFTFILCLFFQGPMLNVQVHSGYIFRSLNYL